MVFDAMLSRILKSRNRQINVEALTRVQTILHRNVIFGFSCDAVKELKEIIKAKALLLFRRN